MAAYNSESMQGCLFVGDLHPDVCEQLLYNTFIPYGFITSVIVIRDIVTGCSRGFGHVIFEHVADAERAMYNLMFEPLYEKPIRIMWYQPDPTLRHSGIGNLYITGLARDIDSYTLYDIFSNFGEILSCKVASDHLGSKGYGFVHFKTMEAAENAIKFLNGMLINDEKVSITHYKTRVERQAERQANKAEPKSFPPSLYVSNLPYYFTNEQLGKLFSTFGTVLSANVMMKNGRSKGFGFVALDNFEATTNALAAMNGRLVGKRILSVTLYNSVEKRRDRAEQECKNDSQQQVHQSAYALPTTRLELCKTEILKTPVKSISCPALRLENSVQTVANTSTSTDEHPVRSNTQQNAARVYRGNSSEETSGHTNQLVRLSSTPQNVMCLYQKDCVQIIIPAELLDIIRSRISEDRTSSRTSHEVLRAYLPALSYGHAQQESVDINMQTTQQDVVGLPHHRENATLHMTQPAVRPKTATALPPKIYSRVLKDMADQYNESFPTYKDAKQSSVWETMKSGMASVVHSPLTWSLIGLYVVYNARR